MFLVLSNGGLAVFLGTKLHGICKQDPLNASIFFGAVMWRSASLGQAAKAPVKSDSWLTTKNLHEDKVHEAQTIIQQLYVLSFELLRTSVCNISLCSQDMMSWKK